MVNLGHNIQHAQPHRAISRAVAAPGAEDLAEFFGIDCKLVQDPLALPAGLGSARVVAGGMCGECRELARVPGSEPRIASRRSGVHNVETMTRRAGERACAATHACERVLLPERVFKMLGD